MADSSWEILEIENEQLKTAQTASKGKTWSHGTNSC